MPQLTAVIHCYDAARNATKDFKCGVETLLRGMRYFQETVRKATQPGAATPAQTLEITVHCDVLIFEWLLGYINGAVGADAIRPDRVLPLLIASNFLQMDALRGDCLAVAAAHLVEVVRHQPKGCDLTALPPELLSGLGKLVSETALEELAGLAGQEGHERHWPLVHRLYKYKLEGCLRELQTTIARCAVCHGLFSLADRAKLPCCGAHAKAGHSGAPHTTTWAPANGVHIPDAGWRLQDYLASLRSRHVGWRGIYWHIWGLAHVLYCHSCMRYIPAVQLHGCAYHPQPPVYGTGGARSGDAAANGGSKGGAGGAGAGFYPCCGAAAVRGSGADPSGSGCRSRDHQVLPAGSSAPSSLSPAVLDTLQRCSHLFTNPEALLQPPGDHAPHARAQGDGGEGPTRAAAPALTPALQAVIDAAAAAASAKGLPARGQGLGSSPDRRAASAQHSMAGGANAGGGGGNGRAVGPALGDLDTPGQFVNLTNDPSLNASVLAAAVARRLARSRSSGGSAGQAATGSSRDGGGGGLSAGGGGSSGGRHPTGPHSASPRSQAEAASDVDLHSATKTSLSVLGNELLDTTCAAGVQNGGPPMGSPRPSASSTSPAAARPCAVVEEAHRHHHQMQPGMQAAHHHQEQRDPQQLEHPTWSAGAGREHPHHPDPTPGAHIHPATTHGWRSVSVGRGLLAAGGGSARPRAPLPGPSNAPRLSTQAGAPPAAPLPGFVRHPAAVPPEEHARLVEVYKTQVVVSPRPGVAMVSLAPGMLNTAREAPPQGSIDPTTREGGAGAAQRKGMFAGRAVFRSELDAGTGVSAAQAALHESGNMPDKTSAALADGMGVRGGGADGAVGGSRRLCMELLHEDDCFRMELLVKHLLACRPSQRGGGGSGGGEGPPGGGGGAMWHKHAGAATDSGAMIGGGGAGWGGGPGQQWGTKDWVASARLSFGSAPYGMGRVARGAAEGRAAAGALSARTSELCTMSVQVERASCGELGAQGVRQSGTSLHTAGSARDPLQPGATMGPLRRPPESSQGRPGGHSARRTGREQVATAVGSVVPPDPVERPWRSPLGERVTPTLEAMRLSDKGQGQVRGPAGRSRPVSAPRVLQNRLGQ